VYRIVPRAIPGYQVLLYDEVRLDFFVKLVSGDSATAQTDLVNKFEGLCATSTSALVQSLRTAGLAEIESVRDYGASC